MYMMTLMPWQQRLTKDELKLCLTLVHQLSKKDRKKRQKIMGREIRRDLFWGFFDSDKDAARKRKFYFLVIHKSLIKHPKRIDRDELFNE